MQPEVIRARNPSRPVRLDGKRYGDGARPVATRVSVANRGLAFAESYPAVTNVELQRAPVGLQMLRVGVNNCEGGEYSAGSISGSSRSFSTHTKQHRGSLPEPHI